MNYWKKFNRLSCGALLCTWLVFCSLSGWAATVDRIVAKVNKEIITLSELEERSFLKLTNYRRMNVQPMPTMEKVMRDELEIMIEEKLLIDDGRQRGYKVNSQRVDSAIQDIERMNGLNEGDLERMLRAESKSLEDYKQKIHDQILMSDVKAYEVRKRVSISDEEIDSYYNQHLKEYWVPGKLKLRHILFLMGDELLEEEKRIKREKAHLAWKKIRSGEDFIAVAKEFSEDVSASTGGDLGEIEQGKMVPEFEKAAINLKEGEVSGLVETHYGLHIIKVEKIIQGRTLPLDEIREKIKNSLMKVKIENELQAYISELKEKAFIENKMPPLPQSPVEQGGKINPEKNLKAASSQNDDSGKHLSLRKKNDSVPKRIQKNDYSRFHAFEEKLRYYKKLRDKEQISEGDYQNKKRELLNQL